MNCGKAPRKKEEKGSSYTVDDLVNRMNFPVERALLVGAQVHTPPEAFGKVMSIVKPRMAVAYHFINDFGCNLYFK